MRRGKDRQLCCDWLCFSISNSCVQIWRHQHLPVGAIWTWVNLTLTHGDRYRMSTGLWLVYIITWWSCNDHLKWMLRRKPKQSINCPQTTSTCFVFKGANWPQLLIPHEDQFNKQNLAYRFMGPIWQLAKTFAREFHVFHSQWQLLPCQSDFTTYARLPEAIFESYSPRMG